MVSYLCSIRLAEGVSFFPFCFSKVANNLKGLFPQFPESWIWIIIFRVRRGSMVEIWHAGPSSFTLLAGYWNSYIESYPATRSTELLVPINSNPFHVNLNKHVLRLERDDVIIISPFAVIVTFARSGATLFCFCWESSTTVPTGFNADLNWGPHRGCQTTNGLRSITRGGSGSFFFFFEGDKGIHCSFLCGPLSLRIA